MTNITETYKRLRANLALAAEHVGLLTICATVGTAMGLGIGAGVGAFYFAVRVFVYATERIFG